MIRMDSFDCRILPFLKSLRIPTSLLRGVQVLNPYQDPTVFRLCELFYTNFYHDAKPRTIIIGINPGRFGGGLTGIPFTDPIRLETVCGIQNTLPKKAELSSEFIYSMINAYGGCKEFYSRFYFTSVSPLGFTKQGKNLNYYDDRKLAERLTPFIVDCLEIQLRWGINRSVAYCLGEGENFKFLSQLNAEHHFFEKLLPLAHPRYIMQYKRKSVNKYIDQYLQLLNQSS
jgi:hypothetical protein